MHPYVRWQVGDTEYPLAGLPISLVHGGYSLWPRRETALLFPESWWHLTMRLSPVSFFMIIPNTNAILIIRKRTNYLFLRELPAFQGRIITIPRMRSDYSCWVLRRFLTTRRQWMMSKYVYPYSSMKTIITLYCHAVLPFILYLINCVSKRH